MSLSLPNDPEAERALLCCVINSPETVARLNGNLCPESFYDPANRAIFQTVAAMQAEKQPVDIATLTSRLRSKGRLDAVGGPAYVTSILTEVPTAAYASQYADTLREKRQLRELHIACADIQCRCQSEQDNADGLVSELAAKVAGIATNGRQKPRRTFKHAILDKMQRIEQNQADGDLVTTGLARLDRESPVKLGDMPVIAGSAKAGKSILALTIAGNLASRGEGVLYFSLEDREPKLVDRLTAGATRVPIIRHHIDSLKEHEVTLFTDSATKMSRWNFTIRDDVFDIQQILSVSRAEKATNEDLGAVFVDYVQLVRGERRKSDSREVEVAGVSRALRLLAMELALPVFVLSQLNKENDTRESKAIENDATAIWRIDKIPRKKESKDDPDTFIDNERAIVIPIQRNGDSGVFFRVAFLGSIARVEDMAHENED